VVIIDFNNPADELKALGWLAGRFSFKTWSNGEVMIDENALPFLARERISFNVKGQPPTSRV
jgi:hypothetical protein